jgi:dihydropteroate synthase
MNRLGYFDPASTSLEFVRRLGEIAATDLPLVAAVSSKSFIGETFDKRQGKRLEGGLAASA